jgi:hypothetical protein
LLAYAHPYDVRVTWGQSVRVSLKQAIEIHAKVLKFRFGWRAPEMAREKAESCSKLKDREGYRVWMEGAQVAEFLLTTNGLGAPP